MKHQRRIILQNANNFRDLGGYAANGGITAWGKLFRTDLLRFLNDQDWVTLRGMGVLTLVDLRGSQEANDNPVPAPSDMTYINLPFIGKAAKKAEGHDENGTDGSFIASLVTKYSHIFRNSLPEITAVLNTLTDALETHSAAFFCSAGKDRTGMTTATILYLCGVAEVDIIADYMVSCTYNSDPERGVYPRLETIIDMSVYGGSLPAPLVRSDPESMKELLDFFRANDVRALLHENGFSYERQALLTERMIQKEE